VNKIHISISEIVYRMKYMAMWYIYVIYMYINKIYFKFLKCVKNSAYNKEPTFPEWFPPFDPLRMRYPQFSGTIDYF